MESSEQVGFYSDGSSGIVDNSTSSHKLSEEDIFTDKIEPIIYNGVESIGGKDHIPKGVGSVSWSWTDDEGKLHTKKFNKVIYLSDLPVIILIATALDESVKNDEGTWVLTKVKYSIFTWDFGK